MSHYQGRSRMCRWLSVSSLLHACFIVPFIVFSLYTPAKHARSRLQIELFGMVADRQVAEKKVAQKAAPPQQVNRPRKPVPAMYRTVATESPVSVHKVEEKPKPLEQETKPVAVSAVTAPPADTVRAASPGADAVQQRQQTIRTAAETEADRIRRYSERVVKRLRSHLVYPKEVRRMGIEAVTTISFIVTDSGNIKGGSLRVKVSSGYTALDASALQSARDSVPFEKPPKEMPLIIGVRFSNSVTRQSLAVPVKQPPGS
ncbi:hypothetical protein AOG2_26190 [Geobacter sp. AOG2]|nr:hypothetical protein AOG2_26190 [Geobacter sp. AOG2]